VKALLSPLLPALRESLGGPAAGSPLPHRRRFLLLGPLLLKACVGSARAGTAAATIIVVVVVAAIKATSLLLKLLQLPAAVLGLKETKVPLLKPVAETEREGEGKTPRFCLRG
jgi:hypothetical protein